MNRGGGGGGAAWVFAAAISVAGAFAGDALAEPFSHVEEEDSRGHERVPAADRDPIRGSTFLFDQSMSLQTLHIDPTAPLSYVPYYGWWLSFRPRYNFDDHLRVQARFDYHKEFTNSQDTTDYREDVFDDIWTDLVYSSQATSGRWQNTRWSLGLRALWPTSKQSQGSGIYVTLGGLAGVSQKIPLRGDDAKVLNSARFGLSLVYLHPFSSSTTATDYGNFSMVSQTDSGMSAPSNQLTGLTLASHSLFVITEAGLQITPKLDLSVSAIWINQWHYAPPAAVVTSPLTGAYTVPRYNDQQFTQFFWLVAAVDYALFDEVSLGAGYYNLANVIGLDGTIRSPFLGGEDNAFWSPDAAFFFDVTANLDKIWERAHNGGRDRDHETIGDTRRAAQSAREARLLGMPLH